MLGRGTLSILMKEYFKNATLGSHIVPFQHICERLQNFASQKIENISCDNFAALCGIICVPLYYTVSEETFINDGISQDGTDSDLSGSDVSDRASNMMANMSSQPEVSLSNQSLSQQISMLISEAVKNSQTEILKHVDNVLERQTSLIQNALNSVPLRNGQGSAKSVHASARSKLQHNTTPHPSSLPNVSAPSKSGVQKSSPSTSSPASSPTR